jgi:hypothetical protein
LGVLISAAILTLAYFAAKGFEIQMLEAWVKVELTELMAAIIIVVFCIGFIATANVAAQFLAQSKTGGDITALAKDSTNAVYNDGADIHEKLAEAYFNLAKLVSYSYTAGINAVVISSSYSQNPVAGLSPLLGDIGQAMDTVSNFMLLAAAQHAFLRFFAGAAAVMLPIGVVARSFTFSRKVGAVILAAIISSAVVYPVSVMLSKSAYDIFQKDMMADAAKIKVPSPGNPPLANVICNPYMQTFAKSPILGGELGWSIMGCYLPLCWIPPYAQCNVVDTCVRIVNRVYVAVLSGFSLAMGPQLAAYGNGNNGFDMSKNYQEEYLDNLSDGAAQAVSKYVVLSLVFFLIPIIITIVLLRSLIVAFGGEPQLYGLSKMV